MGLLQDLFGKQIPAPGLNPALTYSTRISLAYVQPSANKGLIKGRPRDPADLVFDPTLAC